MLHGRLLAGLAVRELERDHVDGGFAVVRLTIDLFSVVPMAPVSLRWTRTRDGRRVRAVEVVVTCEGRDVARAAALLLVPPGAPRGVVWGQPPWDVPSPDRLPASVRSAEAEAMGAPELRFIGPALGDGPGPHRAWLREPYPLVDGEELSPSVRAVIAADVTNPISNWGDEGLQYINSDITVLLVRSPVGEWIGLEVTDHLDASGISAGVCRLYDTTGPIGHAVVTGVSRPFGGGR
jgi:hypothetical protein